MTDKDDKFYKPEFHAVPDVNIPEEDTYESPLNKLGEGRKIKVGLDSDVIIQKLSHEIYSNWRSAIRELYNNEARACRNVMKLDIDGCKPEIHITINPIERQLTIEGRDSEGITVNVFDKSLRVLGVSSNFDSKEIGQMGMGFASYTLVFEALKIETWARETDEKWSALADGGINFDILGDPNMKSYGTRLSGTYKVNIDEDEMIEHIRILSRFSNVSTFIHLTEDTHDYGSGLVVCDQFENGMKWLLHERELMIENGNRRSEENDDTKKMEQFIPINVERDDFEFFGYWCCYNTSYDSIRLEELGNDSNLVTLIGTPIQADMGYHLNHLSGYVLNIKDERKYKPTTDRDRMQDESIDDIVDEIEAELQQVIGEFNLRDIDHYNSKTDVERMMYNSNVWHGFRDVFTDETTKILITTLNKRYTTAPNKHMMSLQDMIQSNKKVVALKGLRKEPMRRLSNEFGDGNVLFFRLSVNDESIHREREIATLRGVGVIMGEEYIRLNKVKSIKRDKLSSESADVSVRIYSDWHASDWGHGRYGEHHTSHLISEINDNATHKLMRVSKDNWDRTQNKSCEFLWVRDRKGYVGIKTLEERLRELGNTMFEVNDEKMLFKDIPKDMTIIYCDIKSDDNHTFNLSEMHVEEHDKAYIYPANPAEISEFLSDVKCMYDIIDIYCTFNDRHYDDDIERSMQTTLTDRLDLSEEATGYSDRIPLNTMVRLNRFKDLVPDNDDLYQLVKRAMLESDEDKSMEILELGLRLGGVVGQLH